MSSVPPVPALPPDLQVQYEQEPYYPSSPHLEEPLLAPRPHKLTPDLPAEVGLTIISSLDLFKETNFFSPDGAHPRPSSIPCLDSSAPSTRSLR